MIGSIGSDSFAASAARSQLVDRFFQKVDTNRDSQISQDELTQVLQSSSETASGTSSSADAAGAAKEIFQILDSEGKGYISRQDVADELDKIQEANPANSGQAQATGRRGGPPPGGGGGGGGGTSAVDLLDIDPADTNQDGTVSIQEQLAYALKQFEQQANQGSNATENQATTILYA